MTDFKKKKFSASNSSTPPPEYEMSSPGQSGKNPSALGEPVDNFIQDIRAKLAPIQSPSGNPEGNINTRASVETMRARFLLYIRYSRYILFGLLFVIGCFIFGIIIHDVVAHPAKSELENRPKFYTEKNYTGGFYTAHENWEKNGCINLPQWINDKTMSIRVGHHCLEIFEHENCNLEQKQNYDKVFEGSYSRDDLEKIKMGNKISSFKLCPK